MTVNNRTQLHRLIDTLPDSLLSEVLRFVELLLFKLQRPEPAKSSPPLEDDPVLALIGAYESNTPLIDGISISEDPTLYQVAETMGDAANDLHAWEILPHQYQKGSDGQAVRHETDERSS